MLLVGKHRRGGAPVLASTPLHHIHARAETLHGHIRTGH